MILLIDNYDSFTYNLYQMLQALSPEPVMVRLNDQITFEEVVALNPTHVVLSPGPGHPGVGRDFGICKEIINRQEELSCAVLGVCLGHQGIAHNFGARIEKAPTIVHGKSSLIEQVGDSPLFAGVPASFTAMRYHSLIVKEDERFPECLSVLARERSQGLIMALRHKTRPLFGVQFHPESIGTRHGETILRNFLQLC